MTALLRRLIATAGLDDRARRALAETMADAARETRGAATPVARVGVALGTIAALTRVILGTVGTELAESCRFGRAAYFSLAFGAIVSLASPANLHGLNTGGLRSVLLSLPSSLALALPFGVLAAACWPARRSPSALALSVVGCLATLLAIGWLLPLSNHLSQEWMPGRPVATGAPAMTLPHLASMVRALDRVAWASWRLWLMGGLSALAAGLSIFGSVLSARGWRVRHVVPLLAPFVVILASSAVHHLTGFYEGVTMTVFGLLTAMAAVLLAPPTDLPVVTSTGARQ